VWASGARRVNMYKRVVAQNHACRCLPRSRLAHDRRQTLHDGLQMGSAIRAQPDFEAAGEELGVNKDLLTIASALGGGNRLTA
jgi:hypothetical protein